MKWTELPVDSVVHVNIGVINKHMEPLNPYQKRLIRLSMNEFLQSLSKLIEYVRKHKTNYFSVHFTCGCNKNMLDPVTGEIYINEELDALCDRHWKLEVLGIDSE